MNEELKVLMEKMRALLCSEGFMAEEPDRPSASVLTEIEFDKTGAPMKSRGKRPQGPEGAIVHYSASRVFPSGDQDAHGVIRFGADEGYYFISISRNGTIVLPSNHDWYSWGYHAGKSKLPNGRAEVSIRCVGIELCNPGMLKYHGGKLYPWYNPNFESSEDHWNKDDCRHSESEANIARGWYLPFTTDQEESLKMVLVWMAKRFEHFKVDWILGHDEVSPGRKTDPGGALSMTMPAFREELRSLLES